MSDLKAAIPAPLYGLTTVGGEQIHPTGYDPATNRLSGFPDRYNVSGDDPLPTLVWDLATGKCESGKEDDKIDQVVLQDADYLSLLELEDKVHSEE